MKKHILTLIAFILVLAPGLAQAKYGKLIPRGNKSVLEIPNGTVAEMEALTSPSFGMVFEVSDGATADDCDTGGGSIKVTCKYTGTGWEYIADAAYSLYTYPDLYALGAMVPFRGDSPVCDLDHVDHDTDIGVLTAYGIDTGYIACIPLPSLFTGVSGVGAVGTLEVFDSEAANLDGVSGTGAVGTLAPTYEGNFTAGLSGVAGTGALGTLAPSAQLKAILDGVTGAGAVGTLAPTYEGNFTAGLSGVAGAGALGTLVPDDPSGVPPDEIEYAATNDGQIISIGGGTWANMRTGAGGTEYVNNYQGSGNTNYLQAYAADSEGTHYLARTFLAIPVPNETAVMTSATLRLKSNQNPTASTEVQVQRIADWTGGGLTGTDFNPTSLGALATSASLSGTGTHSISLDLTWLNSGCPSSCANRNTTIYLVIKEYDHDVLNSDPAGDTAFSTRWDSSTATGASAGDSANDPNILYQWD